ncbi:MAG: cold shock domain-containing protein [Rhodomicrobium sp.]
MRKFATVRFFDPCKGQGFLRPDGGGPDLFVPRRSLNASRIRQLRPGQRVSYETGGELAVRNIRIEDAGGKGGFK